jgi:cysteinyl-tRNA synthetase
LLLKELCDVLGIFPETKEESLNERIEKLIEERQNARKNKDFALADKIRDDLKEEGIILEDTPQGVKWKKI